MSGASPTTNSDTSLTAEAPAAPPEVKAAPLEMTAPTAEAPILKIPEPVETPKAEASIPAPVSPPAAPPPPVVAPPLNTQPSGDGGGRGGIVSRLRGENPDEGGPRMSFIDHLMELRKRLWISIITIIVSMCLALVFYDWLFYVLRWPLDRINDWYRLPENAQEYTEVLQRLKLPPNSDVVQLISTNMLGTMMMVMWIGVGAGLVMSSPIVIYELWSFIAPGLRDKERNAIKPILYGGVFFFLSGVLLTYFLLFPVTLNFVVWLDVHPLINVRPSYTVDDYFTLFINIMWITGLICETPLVVGALAKLKIIKPEHLTKHWRFCVLGSFVFGAIFSPGTDIMSMLVFSLLLLGLYIISVFMAWFFYPKQKIENAAQ